MQPDWPQLVLVQAHILGWPKDSRPSLHRLVRAAKDAAVPMVIPIVILGGFYMGAFTATVEFKGTGGDWTHVQALWVPVTSVT